jgi:LysM repeat protein
MRRLAIALAGVILVAAGCGSSATPSPSSSIKSPAPSGTVSKSPKPTIAPTIAPTESVEPATPEPTATAAATNKTYKVVKGDTLTKIAKKFGITVAVLQAANPKVKPNALKIGQVLVIPPKN